MGSAGWEETDVSEMDGCNESQGCDEKTAGPATGSGIAAEVGSAVWIVEPMAWMAGDEASVAQPVAWTAGDEASLAQSEA